MGCPFIQQQQAAAAAGEKPRDIPYESLHRPWSWALSSLSNIFIFLALLALLAAVLYRRRRSSRRGPKVSYRTVDVLKAADGKKGKIRAVVTGGNGNVGGAIVSCLAEDGGYEVHSLDLTIPDKEDRDPRVTSYIQTDVTSLEDLEIAFRDAEVVFHTAGLSAHSSATSSAFLRVNTTGTEKVVEACVRCGVRRLVYTSSALAVRGRKGCVSDPSGGDTPANTERPLDPYSASKALAEKLVLSANGAGGLATCVLRPAMVLGTRGGATLACLTRQMWHCGGGNDVCWQVAPAASSAQAHLLAERRLREGGAKSVAAGRAYFICGARVPLSELLGKMEGEVTVWGQPPPQSYPRWLVTLMVSMNKVFGMGADLVPAKLSLLPDHNCDSTPAREELGWKMDYPPWEEMVRGVVKEYKDA